MLHSPLVFCTGLCFIELLSDPMRSYCPQLPNEEAEAREHSSPQSHTAGKRQSWHVSPENLIPGTMLMATIATLLHSLKYAHLRSPATLNLLPMTCHLHGPECFPTLRSVFSFLSSIPKFAIVTQCINTCQMLGGVPGV